PRPMRGQARADRRPASSKVAAAAPPRSPRTGRRRAAFTNAVLSRGKVVTGGAIVVLDRDMPGALSRFRMLDLSRQLPGPFCSMLLADLGMDVLAVYAPTDPMGMGIP